MSDIEKKIMSLLKGSENEMQVEEMANELNLTRHTVSKYLAVLKAKKLVTYKTVGRTKLWKEFSVGVKIKPLTKDDISDISRIEERIEEELGIKNKERIEYLKETAIYNIEHGDPMLSIGAEVDGNLVGFMIGELRV
jgi:predicted ArsR family transcriptional regulator